MKKVNIQLKAMNDRHATDHLETEAGLGELGKHFTIGI